MSGQLSGCACLCGAVSRPDPIHCYQSPEYRFSADISLHTFNQTRRKYIPSPLYNWTMLFTPTCSALKRFVRRGPNSWPAVAWPRSLGSHLVRHQYSISNFCDVYQYFWGAISSKMCLIWPDLALIPSYQWDGSARSPSLPSAGSTAYLIGRTCHLLIMVRGAKHTMAASINDG